VQFANAALEDALGMSRRSIDGHAAAGLLHRTPALLENALHGASGNHFAALRYDAWLKRLNHELLPVHVVVAQTDNPGEVIVELLPLEQQARQEREERLIDQAQANKELIRNLAHEIKNPLGGIRGAAQLLQMELESRELIEYTQVIIHEADRLQSLVDRLLAPHRRPHVVGDVNIHEVCERVRSLILAEFPKRPAASCATTTPRSPSSAAIASSSSRPCSTSPTTPRRPWATASRPAMRASCSARAWADR
jgi:two-component system nitrogen regulation sensor histidine kinase GlnL